MSHFYFTPEDETEFIPIIPINEGEQQEDADLVIPETILLLPLRNTVLFPTIVLPITAGRTKSIQAIQEAYKTQKIIGVITQKEASIEEPAKDDLCKIGTVAKILKLIEMPDGGTTVIIQGKKRFQIQSITQENPYFKANIELLPEDIFPNDNEFEAYISTMRNLFSEIIQLSPNIPKEASVILKNINHPSFLINFISSNLSSNNITKQQLLEINNPKLRTEKLIELLQTELQFAELKHKVTNKTRTELDKQQREYFLQQQLKSIKEELGDGNDREIAEMKKRAETKQWPQAAAQLFQSNIEKLERMHPSTPDYSIIYNHLELMLGLPWNEYTSDAYNLANAQKILDNAHYGMTKIKERILEYLAVLKLKSGNIKSPILCFVGPPGIGKTSLGKSIAQAIGRKYVRVSLGGLHDESEIRGHRKTYIGAMPGRILQNIKKAQTSNPVMILDEIDKIGNDFRGDPSSALLEVLDPEQNNTFYDNYLELEYDLSKVLFIATANSIQNIQPALKDRLEIIELSGYAIEEKIEIAKKHLIPKQKEIHGLENMPLKLSDKVLEKIIQSYTRESGVRELDRQLAKLMRYIAREYAEHSKATVAISLNNLETVLGSPVYSNEIYKTITIPGVAIGLAWTYVGGEILFIETLLSNGKGELRLTGNLGNVMKESASTALTYLQANAKKLHIKPTIFSEKNIHIHVPEGAVPKDGPSAGITMLTSLASAFTGRKVKPYVAMTGEITLRGQVLPVGGIKEKVLAAKRAGIKEIILSAQNEKDVKEIEAAFIKNIRFHYVHNMQEVLTAALL